VHFGAQHLQLKALGLWESPSLRLPFKIITFFSSIFPEPIPGSGKNPGSGGLGVVLMNAGGGVGGGCCWEQSAESVRVRGLRYRRDKK
jgi:hypothetical protein